MDGNWAWDWLKMKLDRGRVELMVAGDLPAIYSRCYRRPRCYQRNWSSLNHLGLRIVAGLRQDGVRITSVVGFFHHCGLLDSLFDYRYRYLCLLPSWFELLIDSWRILLAILTGFFFTWLGPEVAGAEATTIWILSGTRTSTRRRWRRSIGRRVLRLRRSNSTRTASAGRRHFVCYRDTPSPLFHCFYF